MDDALAKGFYARKQLFSPSRLIRWSHRRRFVVAVERSRGFAGMRVLDFGCGDGTYLHLLAASPHAPASAVGAEIDPRIVADCRERLAGIPNLQFVLQEALEAPEYAGSFDAVVCMEVLEHTVDRDRYLALFERLLRPGGRLLVSVPVETGLPFVVKHIARTIAGWRGIGDYPGPAPYTWPELARAAFAGRRQHLVRPVHYHSFPQGSHCHKGFNWMVLRSEIAARFDLGQVGASPLTGLSPHLGSQAWFEARRRGRPA